MPHCELQTSSRKMASLGHCLISWPQSVMRREAHWALKQILDILKLKKSCKPKKTFLTYPLGWANTTGTWWGEGWFSNPHMTITNLATLNIFTPSTQIDLWHWMAGNTRISEIKVIKIMTCCTITIYSLNCSKAISYTGSVRQGIVTFWAILSELM